MTAGNASSYSAAAGARQIQKVTAQVSETDDPGIIKNRDTISKMGKAISGIRYNHVFNNTVDLRYSVLHGKIEEDVILNSPDGFTSYTLTVHTNGLSATKCSDNSVAFQTASGETIFTLGAPWMKDSYISVSDDIEVTVRQIGHIAYITYTPDSTWLHDASRVYPVLIDPSFTTRYYTSNYEDTYVYSGDSASTTRPTETTMKVGNISGNPYYAYIKILNVPDLVGGSIVDEATLHFWVNTTSSPALSIYEVTESWSPTTITYASQPDTTLITSGKTGESNGTNSEYSIDLTSWMNGWCYYWGDLSDFFASSRYNGFKIAYTTNITGNYTQIYSSEYSTATYRPVMTIRYTYSCSSDGIEDGAVYSFVNSASNKYLTVDGGNAANETNIYQYTKNNSISQAFRLDYDDTYNCFRIRPMCSNNGYGSVLEVWTFSRTITNAGYAARNVRINSCSTPPNNSQEWLVTPHGSGGLFKIVLRADPNLALTSYGTGNGTANGTTSTSEGNVFVSEFTGAANQLWKVESGGIQIADTPNIKITDAKDISYSIYENKTWLSFCCPATEYGDTVAWYSDNTQSATVDATGNVTTNTAGKVTVHATVTHSDGTSDSYACTLYVILTDGVYYFNNVCNTYCIEYKDPNALYENAALEVFDSGTAEPTERFRMFKVKYLGECIYSIRSMLDSSMGWTESSEGLVMTNIGTSDRTVPQAAKWVIESNSNGYYIHTCDGTRKTVTSSSSSGSNIVLRFLCIS